MSPNIRNYFIPTEVSDGEQVAWVTLGSITYLDGSLRDVWADWLGVLDALLTRPWASHLQRLRRSDYPRVSSLGVNGIHAYRQELAQTGAGRSHLAGELCDDLDFPETSIEFRDIGPSQWGAFARASYLRIRLPLETHPDELVWISRLLGNRLPINQGAAGYLCHLENSCRGLSSDQAWAWARRYYGVHVVEPVAVSWDAPRGLCGSNWLTLLSKRWLQEGNKPGPDAVNILSSSNVTVDPLVHGYLLQAGSAPLLGDQNQGEDLNDYSEVALALEPGFVESPTSYLGMFSDVDCTEAWMRRLVDPAAWRDCSQ